MNLKSLDKEIVLFAFAVQDISEYKSLLPN